MNKSLITLLFIIVSSVGFAQALKSWQWNELHTLPYDYLKVGKLDVLDDIYSWLEMEVSKVSHNFKAF